jgi:amino acid adenylation domain-containing protein
MTVNDKYIDTSREEEKTIELKVVARKTQPKTPIVPRTPPETPIAPRMSQKAPMVPRTPKKTRLERMSLTESLSGTTSTMLQAIKRVNAECLPEYFEQTCDWRSQKVAVIYGSTEITYQELDQRANRLAHLLIAQGVGKGEPIGILLEHSLNSYIALLGILKAGAAFVPLDPSFSASQMTFIAQDAGLRRLITTSAFREKTGQLRCSVLELDQAREVIAGQDRTRPQVRVAPASLCYIIYILDSTGQPEGIAFSHANIVNFLRAFKLIYGVRSNDRVYQGMPLAFDFALEEIWPAWIAGATLVVGPADAPHDDYAFTEFLIEQRINVLCCVPAQLAIIERDVPTLHTILIGGEVCPTELISRWSRPGRRMLGTYGPAATTITTTWCELSPNRPANIGTPLPTAQVYILDSQLRPVKDGESGEICIGGLGVTLGYINRPDLAQERFTPNPVRHEREIVPRLYRTGDLGRMLPTGEIEHLGPIAPQARMRGYRSELRRIEQLILPQSHPAQFNAYAATLPGEISATPRPEKGASRLARLKQINLKESFTHIITDPLYRNSIFSMASTFILGGLGFIFWIVTARLYTTEDVGIATTLISVMSLLSSFTLLGLNISLNRYLPKSANKSELINSSFVLVTLATFVACTIFLLGLQVFSPQLLFLRSNIFYALSFTLLVTFCSLNTIIESIFMAFRSTSNTLVKNSIISITKLALPFSLIAFGAYGLFASAASAIAFGVIVSFIILIFKFKIRPAITINVPLIKEISVYSFANYATDFTLYMPPQVLPIIILNVLSAKYVAYYYIASMIQNILLIIPMSASQALLTEGAYDERDLKKHTKKAFSTILVILVPATAVIVCFGNILLQAFGKSYADEAFQFLQLFSASTILTALLLVSNAILNVKHQIGWLVTSNIIATIIALALPYAFISGGLTGIGWGWLLGQAITALIALFFIITRVYSGVPGSSINK